MTVSMLDETIIEIDKLWKSKQFTESLCRLLEIPVPETHHPIVDKIKQLWDSSQFRGKLFFLIGQTYMAGTSY